MVYWHAEKNFLTWANGHRRSNFLHIAPWYLLAFRICTVCASSFSGFWLMGIGRRNGNHTSNGTICDDLILQTNFIFGAVIRHTVGTDMYGKSAIVFQAEPYS